MSTVLINPFDERTGQSTDRDLEIVRQQQCLIEGSHLRSKSYGIDRNDEPDFSTLPVAKLSNALDENKFLLQYATPVMESLYEQIANTHNMVLLTSSKGLVLHSLGDTDFLEKATRVALMPGADWSENIKGTNAIGTTLKEELAVTVNGNQHYMNANKFLTCSCAPIFDPYGQVLGALDVSGDQRSFHQHTMALVRMSAQMIENRMFANMFPKAIRIHFHTRSEFLGTLVEGIVVFSPEGRFLSANRGAQIQLGLLFNALKAHTFSSLFGIPVSKLLELCRGVVRNPVQLCMHNGVTVWCRVKMKPTGQWHAGQYVTTAPDSQLQATDESDVINSPAERAAAAATHKLHLSTLRYLDTGDPQVAAVIHKLEMIRGRDIPIMILGETGTGKDLLAQAIHGDSNRAGQAFVSVNCASIPESLIESELFGYEEGAFTGARKKGSIGKIQQAHGGTLFLDEIGDMPRHLQARLLRVLQDRKVNPLGSGKEVEVDVAVICATNRNLKEMIANNDFREDLYYRLNGLVVRLPALRDRTDFELVAKKILSCVCEKGRVVGISADVMALFHAYSWPGNFRQLHNLLRTAAVMVDCQGVIQRSHLPEDFLTEQLHQQVDLIAALQVPAAVEQTASTRQALAINSGSGAPQPPDDAGLRLQDVTLVAMAKMLQLHKGNVSAAAKALGVSRNTLYRRKDQLPPDTWN